MNNTGALKGRTVYMSGASQGIGLAIAKKIAADDANIIIAARTTEPSPGFEETIYTAAEEIEKAGGQCLPCKVDVRNEDDIKSAIENGVKKFGKIDIVINVCSNLNITPVLQTKIENFDNMQRIITRGAFLTSKLCHPHLKNSDHAHILNLSPPINMDPAWFKLCGPYAANKYSVSMYTIGMAQEFKPDNIAANSLWPKKVTYSTGVKNTSGPKAKKYCRNTEIMADAAYAILIRDPKVFTGNLVMDEDVLKSEGITNFDQYLAEPGSKEKLLPDLFTDEVPDFTLI